MSSSSPYFKAESLRRRIARLKMLSDSEVRAQPKKRRKNLALMSK